jgi:hypothetical protein
LPDAALVPGVLKVLALMIRLHAAVPDLGWSDTFEHVIAAEHASSAHVRPELLLAIAFIESRFDATATSRVEGGKRVTGRYPSTTRPARLITNTSLFCGPLQTFAGSWNACMELRKLPNAYAAGVTELEQWLRDPRVRGDIGRVLAGHGCGNYGVLTGKCNAYPKRVLRMQAMLSVAPVGHRSPTAAAATRRRL